MSTDVYICITSNTVLYHVIITCVTLLLFITATLPHHLMQGAIAKYYVYLLSELQKHVLCISYTMPVGLHDSSTPVLTQQLAFIPPGSLKLHRFASFFEKFFRGSMPPDPPRNARLRRAMQYISCFTTWTFGPPLHKFLNTPLSGLYAEIDESRNGAYFDTLILSLQRSFLLFSGYTLIIVI